MELAHAKLARINRVCFYTVPKVYWAVFSALLLCSGWLLTGPSLCSYVSIHNLYRKSEYSKNEWSTVFIRCGKWMQNINENWCRHLNVIPFMELNSNNRNYAQYQIWIGPVWPIPDPAKITVSMLILMLNIGSVHP